MGWHTGTATDFKDLLNQLQAAATVDGWTVQSYTTGGASPNTDQLIMKGPGLGVGFEVQIGIRTFQDTTNNFFCWDGYGFTAYDSSRLLLSQINISPAVVMRLWDASIPYWISISDRRVIVVAKCSNTYHSIHLGFIDPFSSPIEYPFPFYLASDSSTHDQFGTAGSFDWSIANPGLNAAYVRDPQGIWCKVCITGDGSGGFGPFGASRYTIWPYYAPDNGTDNWTAPPNQQFEAQNVSADAIPTMNCYVMACFDKGGVLGVLEGVYWVPGHGLSAEQTLTVGSDTFIVFICINRSIEQPSSFYAIKEA